MPTTATAGAGEPAAGTPAGHALYDLADGLTGYGFDIRGPAWDRSQHLHMTNVRGALCEIDFTGDGRIVWEYRRCHGFSLDPDEITGMVLGILGATGQYPGLAPVPGLTFKGVVGRALTARGMAVRLVLIHCDELNFDVYAEIEAVNPDRPDRGLVNVADDGTVRWECALVGSLGSGLGPGDVAEIIATALAGQHV